MISTSAAEFVAKVVQPYFLTHYKCYAAQDTSTTTRRVLLQVKLLCSAKTEELIKDKIMLRF